MIEDVATERLDSRTVRLASQAGDEETLRAQGLSDRFLAEMLDFIRAGGRADDPNEFLDRPFAPKPQYLREQTRFSDGALPVFYSALEAETARAEMRFHTALRILLGDRTKNRVAFFRQIECDFGGLVRNLLPEVVRLPFLIEGKETGAYDRCNEIAAEARGAGLDGLITPSARRPNGTCLPVFNRQALSRPVLGEWIAFRVDADTGEIHETVAP